jgi:hypothetical protein
MALRQDAHYSGDTVSRSTTELRFGDFSGGVNTSVSPEFLGPNELAEGRNWEYEYLSGAIRVRDGTETKVVLSGVPTGIFWAPVFEHYLVSETVGTAHKLYAVAPTSWTETLIGTLSGSESPMFAPFGDNGEILIASGGVLQQVSYDSEEESPWTLTAVTALDGYAADAYTNVQTNCNYVWTRNGHVGVAATDGDVIQYSGLGDPAQWNCSASGVDKAYMFEVGYKEGFQTVAVCPLVTDLLIYKAAEDGSAGVAYRAIGDPWNDDFSLVAQSHDAVCVAPRGAVAVKDEAFYIDRRGLLAFGVSSSYGDIASSEPGGKLNTDLSKAASWDGWCYSSLTKRVVVINPNNGKTVYALSTVTGGIFPWVYPWDVTGMCDNGDRIIIACGDGKLREIGEGYFTDDEESIHAIIRTATTSNISPYCVKSLGAGFVTAETAVGEIKMGKVIRPWATSAGGDIAYADTDVAHSDTDPLVNRARSLIRFLCNARVEEGYIKFSVTSGRVTLRFLFALIAEVG